MVLVSNEWQKQSEDEQKSSTVVVATSATGTESITPPITTAAETTTTTTAVAITSTISPATATIVNTDSIVVETIAVEAVNSKSPTIASSLKPSTTTTEGGTTGTVSTNASPPLSIKFAGNDNNNERQHKDKNPTITEKIACNNNRINDNSNSGESTEKSNNDPAAVTNNLKEDDYIASVLNYSNIKIMAEENTKEMGLKEDQETETEPIENNITNPNETSLDLASNLIVNSCDDKTLVKDLNESNSVPNSNANTLQPSVKDFNSALQSALNASATGNTNSSTAAAGLQPNFLSQLSLTANVAGLQKNAKPQMNSSFALSSAATVENTQIKPDSNLLDASSNNVTTASLATVVPSIENNTNDQAKIVLICEGNSHPFQTRTISLIPKIECMVGRLIAKSKVSENNAIFECKVLSRKHAVIWYTPDGKFWVKDTKSANGTFINDNKLGDEEAELHFGDIVKFGVDVVENSRKEVHGCIIACVKLYLPDGREAISIDSPAHRSPYSGEGRISYDDLHRLNLYIQETAQREKVLTSKLCSIQNILDATRKNSALCWQSMITEDQLLHRIHSLEKKLSFMEKNVPENVLRNEVLKLLDDKNSYTNTAKEALRKVYQERCDAVQMLAKMESAYTQSNNECAILRDQIMNSKQTLQEVNTRLLHLETEYNDFRDDVTRQQKEAKEREEQRISELTEKLRERELECDELKRKISELLIKRADLLDDEEKILENQAIEKLDAAIADMDLGDYDDDDDDDDENDEILEVNSDQKDKSNAIDSEARDDFDAIKSEKGSNGDETASTEIKKQTNLSTKPPLSLTSIFGDATNGIEGDDKAKDKSPKITKSKKAKMLASLNQGKTSPPKRVKESTIMKWLQNSDLNKNEGSLDIFKAICNENEDETIDSSDEEEDVCDAKFREIKVGEQQAKSTKKSNDFTKKLRNVEQNLKELEAEIENLNEESEEKCGGGDMEEGGNKDQKKSSAKIKDVYEFDENSDDDDEESGASGGEETCIIKRNGGKTASTSATNKVLSKHNKNYQLLKSSVNMLIEAYNEIKDSVRDGNRPGDSGKGSSSPPPLVKLQTQNPKGGKSPITSNDSRLLETPDSSRTSCEDIDQDTDSISDVESISLNSPVNSSSHSTIKQIGGGPHAHTTANVLLEEQLREYKQQVGKLNEKLQQTELEAHHTLEIMQVECDDVKQKMLTLNKVIEALKEDKKALEQVINENKTNAYKIENKTSTTTTTTTSACSEVIDSQRIQDIEDDVMEEDDLANINVTALEREEELITYKERLEEQQKQNIELRNEIAALKLKPGRGNAVVVTTTDFLLRLFLPCGFIILAILVYLISTYF
ncbi:sarcolemma associated protein isoform X2 [Haematobia irritans]|uniref:sarcolemma associated protein isoform X2 n=1 Tax=Haematobia irritans TaxID=7368 RepID=UPI003F4FCEAB